MTAAADRPSPAVEPLGVVSLTDPTVFPAHPSPDPHRVHLGVLRGDGTLLTSTVEDRRHGAHTYIPPDPTRFDGLESLPREAVYAGPLHHAYGHFLLESCQRLWWAADHPDLPIVWTAGDESAAELSVWQQDILEILGVRNEVVICTRPTRIDRLHVPDVGYRYADWSHPQHMAFLAAYQGPPQQDGAKLWLSRDPAHGSGLINRQIVERRLRDLGWTIVTFELMPVRAQLDALARGEVIAGEEASTFHNLLLLSDIRGKRFHVFRRHGPEHLSFRTIGDAREVDQQFHSCSHDAVLSVSGRAVVRLAPNPAQYLSHLGIPVPPRQSVPADGKPGQIIARLNRLAAITGAQTYLQLGCRNPAAITQVEVASRDVVADEFDFDVRSYRNLGAQFYEVSLDQFVTWFAKDRTYDLVLLDDQHDWRAALDNIRTIFASAAHERTVLVLNAPGPVDEPSALTGREAGLRRRTDAAKTVLALHDLHPELDYRTIGADGGFKTVIWRRKRTVRPRFGGEEEIGALTSAETEKHRDLLATVTEDRAMAEVQDWLSPRSSGPLSRLVRRVSARCSRPADPALPARREPRSPRDKPRPAR